MSGSEARLITTSEQFEIDQSGELLPLATLPIGEARELIRIEARCQVSWSGVDSCDDINRVRAEFKTELEKWVGYQMFLHQPRQLQRYGYRNASWGYHQRREFWGNGARDCTGWGHFDAYAEFL